MKKEYIKTDFKNGYPSGKDVFYECEICYDIIPSAPSKITECKCKNIIIDPDFGRIIIREESKIKVFKK